MNENSTIALWEQEIDMYPHTFQGLDSKINFLSEAISMDYKYCDMFCINEGAILDTIKSAFTKIKDFIKSIIEWIGGIFSKIKEYLFGGSKIEEKIDKTTEKIEKQSKKENSSFVGEAAKEANKTEKVDKKSLKEKADKFNESIKEDIYNYNTGIIDMINMFGIGEHKVMPKQYDGRTIAVLFVKDKNSIKQDLTNILKVTIDSVRKHIVNNYKFDESVVDKFRSDIASIKFCGKSIEEIDKIRDKEQSDAFCSEIFDVVVVGDKSGGFYLDINNPRKFGNFLKKLYNENKEQTKLLAEIFQQFDKAIKDCKKLISDMENNIDKYENKDLAKAALTAMKDIVGKTKFVKSISGKITQCCTKANTICKKISTKYATTFGMEDVLKGME